MFDSPLVSANINLNSSSSSGESIEGFNDPFKENLSVFSTGNPGVPGSKAGIKKLLNPLIYNLREDFYLFERTAEYQALGVTAPKKSDFFANSDKEIGRSYSSLSKRVERISALGPIVKFVVFFFAKKFVEVATKRKVMSPQGRDFEILPFVDDTPPPDEQSFFDKVKKAYRRHSKNDMQFLWQLFKEFQERQSANPQGEGPFYSKYFAKEIEAQLKSMGESKRRTTQQLNPSTPQHLNRSNSQPFTPEPITPISEPVTPASASLPAEEASVFSATPVKPKRTARPRKVQMPSPPSACARLTRELSVTEARVFDFVVAKLCQKFRLSKGELLESLCLEEGVLA